MCAALFAMKVCDKEWSFGYCENGTGVFCCPPAMNPMYTHRESIVLGHIFLSRRHIGQILLELSQEWNGSSYDPLSRNCNHFCDALCERLGVQKLPCKALSHICFEHSFPLILDPTDCGMRASKGYCKDCILLWIMSMSLLYNLSTFEKLVCNVEAV